MYSEILNFCTKQNVSLIVVTKTRPVSKIMEFYNKGHRAFGENRVQELVEKHDAMPKDIEWHMIGHLQSNKVKYIAPFVQMIHSGASFSLLHEINKRANQNNRIIDVLLQIKIGQEEAKSGWDQEMLWNVLNDNFIQSLEHIKIRGVMGMATFTSDSDVVRGEFGHLKSIFDRLKAKYFSEDNSFDTISMGMSGDYKIAVEEGSTMVRIGSLLYQE